jgi:hypothetical protein
MKIHSMGRRPLFLALLLTGACSKVFLQDDGFAQKLQAGCSDEAACLRLQVEAQQRIVRCQPNTVGYVRCSDAEADKLLADSYVARYASARKDADRKEQERRRQEAEAARAAARARVESERRQRELDALLAEIEREKKTLDACAASEPAREARRRRQGILENGHPGDTVRKQCSARTEMHSVSGECTDEHGFKRTCTKSVAGDVVGYVCPKSVDEEVVQLGLYQLGIRDDYPYPEDRGGRAADMQCDRARERSKQLTDRLERSGQ